jgi:hypothetical protein
LFSLAPLAGHEPELASNQIFKDLDAGAGDLRRESLSSTGLERRPECGNPRPKGTRSNRIQSEYGNPASSLNAKLHASRKLGKLIKNRAKCKPLRCVQKLRWAIGTSAETTEGFETGSWCLKPRTARTARLTRTSSTLANLGPFRKGCRTFFRPVRFGGLLFGSGSLGR